MMKVWAVLILALGMGRGLADYAPRADVFPGDEENWVQFWHKTFYGADAQGNYTEKWVGLYGRNLVREVGGDAAFAKTLPVYRSLSRVKTNAFWVSAAVSA